MNADQPPGASRPSRRWGRVAAVAVATVVLAAGVAWFAQRWSERGAEEASITDAVEAARRKEADHAPASGEEGAPMPGPGVYTYAATGTEQLSVLGTTQQWGDTVPGTVTVLDGDCFELRLDYSTNHWQSTTYCRRGETLEDHGGKVFQRFDFVATTVTDESTFVCDPPGEAVRFDAEAGDTWEQSCTGGNPGRGTTTTSAGTNTFVGAERLEVGAETVPVLRYRLERRLSGSQAGSESVDLWYDADTGMVVKAQRSVNVASPSPIGDVTYTETGSYVLTSLTPAG